MDTRAATFNLAQKLARAIYPFILEPHSFIRAVEITRDKYSDGAQINGVMLDAFVTALRGLNAKSPKKPPRYRKPDKSNKGKSAKNNDAEIMRKIAAELSD